MLGTIITHLPIFAQGSNGYIVVVDMDDLFVDKINSVEFIRTTDPTLTKVVKGTTITLLNNMLNTTDAVDVSWAYSSSLLYLFLTNYYPYIDETMFIVFGTRTGVPINSFDDKIDVPEKHLELFVKYAIKESAQLLGRQVPPSIEVDIRELESRLNG